MRIKENHNKVKVINKFYQHFGLVYETSHYSNYLMVISAVYISSMIRPITQAMNTFWDDGDDYSGN